MKRRLLAGLVGLAATASVLGLATPPASATPIIPQCQLNTSCGVTYYSNAQHAVAVGYRGRDCQGQVVTWGTISGYTAQVSSGCGGLNGAKR